MSLPTDAKARKEYPVGTGVIDYFPDALAEVAKVSYVGNQQHNPGQPLHWERGKSPDHPDCLIRHFIERGKMDNDNVRHSAKMAWRALAILQLEIEEAEARDKCQPTLTSAMRVSGPQTLTEQLIPGTMVPHAKRV